MPPSPSSPSLPSGSRRRAAEAPARHSHPATCGGDLTICPDEMELESKGMTFVTRRNLDVCSEMELMLSLNDELHRITGMVVSCRPMHQRPGCFETTLFFVNAPAALERELGGQGRWRADGAESDWAVRRAWIPHPAAGPGGSA